MPVVNGKHQRWSTTDPQRVRLLNAASDIYQGHGPDLGWADNVPDDDTFYQVVADLLHTARDYFRSGRELTDEDLQWFYALPEAEKRALILEVGP